MDSQAFENNLIHVLTWTLSKLEDLCKEIVTVGASEWPTLEQLVTSGQLGKDIISILATLKPVITFLQQSFPQDAALINWIVEILEEIAKFDTVNTLCSCTGCNS